MLHSFFKFLFYAPAILAILYELMIMLSPVQATNFVNSMHKKKKDDKWTGKQKAFVFLNMCYFLWLTAGIFTSQWFLFVLLIFMGMIRKPWPFLKCIDAAITTVVLVFTVLNAYHFHIDVLKLIISRIGGN